MEPNQLTFDERSRFDRKVVTAGLWLRVGTAAAFVVAGGVVAIFNGDVTPAQALAMALGGATVCAFAWRRAWRTMTAADAQCGLRVTNSTKLSAGSGLLTQ
jgi:hypothetical protein